jgi:hypothetical protein
VGARGGGSRALLGRSGTVGAGAASCGDAGGPCKKKHDKKRGKCEPCPSGTIACTRHGACRVCCGDGDCPSGVSCTGGACGCPGETTFRRDPSAGPQCRAAGDTRDPNLGCKTATRRVDNTICATAIAICRGPLNDRYACGTSPRERRAVLPGRDGRVLGGLRRRRRLRDWPGVHRLHVRGLARERRFLPEPVLSTGRDARRPGSLSGPPPSTARTPRRRAGRPGSATRTKPARAASVDSISVLATAASAASERPRHDAKGDFAALLLQRRHR